MRRSPLVDERCSTGVRDLPCRGGGTDNNRGMLHTAAETGVDGATLGLTAAQERELVEYLKSL